jgi:hypothetical protein
VAGASRENLVNMDTGGYCTATECLAIVLGDASFTVATRGAFSAMLSTGFRINWTAVDGTQPYVLYIALKGGSYRVGNFNTRTDGNDIQIATGLPFTPKGGLFFSANRAADTPGTATAEHRISIGAFDSATSRIAHCYWDQDGTAESAGRQALETDGIYANVDATPAVQGVGDVKTVESDGLVGVMDTPDVSANFVGFILFGNASAGATGSWGPLLGLQSHRLVRSA